VDTKIGCLRYGKISISVPFCLLFSFVPLLPVPTIILCIMAKYILFNTSCLISNRVQIIWWCNLQKHTAWSKKR